MEREHACDPEALEALLRRELDPDRAAVVEGHAVTCRACERELSWLRVERALFLRRAMERSSAPSWATVAPRLGPPAPIPLGARFDGRVPGPGPYRDPGTLVPPRGPRGRVVGWAVAAAAVGILTVGLGVGLRARMAGTRTTVRSAPGMTVGGFGARASRRTHAEASITVSGPVTVGIQTHSADVLVVPADGARARVAMEDGDARVLGFQATGGGRYRVRFDGRSRLRSGRVRLELPTGSGLEVVTTSGDVRVGALAGALRVQSSSGDVVAERVVGADVETVSGDVRLASAEGRVRVRTVSGDVAVMAAGTDAPGLDLVTTSGELTWRGRCGEGCALAARSGSGDLRLVLAPGSGFALRYATASGALRDALGVGALRDPEDDTATGRYGSGAGRIECSTVSGDLALEH